MTSNGTSHVMATTSASAEELYGDVFLTCPQLRSPGTGLTSCTADSATSTVLPC